MKYFVVLSIVLISAVTIFLGKTHYENKLEETATTIKSEETTIESETITNSNEDIDDKVDILSYTKNLPPEISSKIETALESNQPIELVIMGSESTPEGPEGWPTLFKEELIKAYGEDLFHVTIKEILDKTSVQFVNEELYNDVIELNPDIFLFEPFILYNNSHFVSINRGLDNLSTILEKINDSLPDTTIIIQPANPLHSAKKYPIEVEELKTFAEENNYLYLDHWNAWPESKTELLEYIDEGLPTEKGHEVWANYLLNYFIAK